MNGIDFATLSRADMDQAIGAIGPLAGHYAELLRAVRDLGLALIEVPRAAAWPKRALEAVRKPAILLLGDDDYASTGPTGWRALNAAVRWPRAAVVHASGAEPGQYQAFAALAVLCRRLLLIETASVFGETWLAALARYHIPVARIQPPPGEVHPNPVPAEALN